MLSTTLTAHNESIEQLIRNILTLGWVGVPMFFVISGYCIMASAMKLRAQGGSSFTFFHRRFRRIFPPYWAYLAASAAIVGIVEWFAPEAYSHPHHCISYPANIAPIHWTIEKPILTTFHDLGFSTRFNTLTVIIPLCVTASVAIGYLFHRYVELRFMHSPVIHAKSPWQETTSYYQPTFKETPGYDRPMVVPEYKQAS